MNTPRWIIIVALILALSLPATPVNAAASASVTMTDPLPNPAPVGTEVSFALVINVTDIMPGVSGADIYLGYDNTRVAPPPSPNSVVEALPDFFGVSDISIREILPAVQCPGGALPCVHLVVAGPAQVTHSGAVARFHFRIHAKGEACFKVLSSTLANRDGFTVEHTVDPRRKCVNSGATVIGTAFRQGTPANPNPGGGSLACTEVTLIGGATIGAPVVTDGSGRFTFNDVSSSTYTVHAAYAGHLASATTINVPGGSTTVDTGPTELCGGDVNTDNKINILDIGRIIGKFGSVGLPVRSDTQEGCTDLDKAEDINDDGLINISDLAIAAGNWGHTAPTPWQPDGICDP